jgi:Zn-dependent protease with chaperone function
VNSRRHAFIYAGLSVASLSCVAFLVVCPHRADCLRSLTEASTSVRYSSEVVLPLLVVSALAWLVRLSWILAMTLRWMRRLEPVPIPPAIRAAAERTGTSRVVTVHGATPEAVCAGIVRPCVVVTDALAEFLYPTEIDAVLLHEREHVRWREPLLRAALHAAGEVLFYLPLVRWLAQCRLEESELRADRAVLDRLGPKPLAGALWVLGDGPALQGAAAFGSAAQLRVAQVLGEPVQRCRLACSTVAISAMGGYVAFQAASCAAQALAHL